MGTWGTGNFENDAALDWIEEFKQNPSTNFINKTLDTVFNENYIQADDASAAIGAVEVIIAVKDNNDVPIEIRNTIKNINITNLIIEKAQAGLKKIIHRKIQNYMSCGMKQTRLTNGFCK